MGTMCRGDNASWNRANGVTSIEECEAACTSSSVCTAFDINALNECHVHYTLVPEFADAGIDTSCHIKVVTGKLFISKSVFLKAFFSQKSL